MPEISHTIVSRNAPEPVGPYPHARRVGCLLFLSGIGPRRRGNPTIPGVTLDANGKIVDYDIEIQCCAVFENIRTVLDEAGSSWDRLVDVTVFLTDLERDFETYNRVYAQYFTGHGPCRTTVEVSRLPTPIAIELKCIATID
ncbi:RidA family protein [soil metagenome]